MSDLITKHQSSEPPKHRHDNKLPNVVVSGIVPTPAASESDITSPVVADTRSSHCYIDLLSNLSLEEKVALLSGSSFTETTGVPRLSIPRLKVSDSINGVRGTQSHLEDKGTACFPSTTCLASTWDIDLLYDFGHEVGLQAKTKSVQVVIGPNINLHRDPRGGRNFETFSEDPLLTGKLAASIVNGMQSTGVGACAKHFVGNESETKRRKYNVRTSANSRTMRELYMKAFQYMLRDSKPVSIMMAYNKLDGQFCSQTPLIKEVLRASWGYDGCTMSDWYGTRGGPSSLRAGLDLEMPGPSVFRGDKLVKEVRDGIVSEPDIDEAARSILSMLDRTAGSHSDDVEQTIICERTSLMARKVAVEGIVLLKNDQSILPLDVGRAGTMAVIGAPAVAPIISGGGSACAQPQYLQTFLECLQSEHPCPELVRHTRGINPHHSIPALSVELLGSVNGCTGVQVNYYNNGVSDAVHSEFLESTQVVMLGRLKPGLQQQNFHYVLTATLNVPSTGRHTLGAQVTGDFVLELDGTPILQGSAPDITVEDFLFVPKKLERTTDVFLEANKQYEIRLTVQSRKSANNGEPTPHAAKLVFQEAFDNRTSIAEAVALASTSDTSIIFGGRTHEHESEGFDLENISLDPNQVRLIKAVSAVSKNTILVLHHGNPIDLSPIVDDVDAILAAHFPGQEGASALTQLITGRTAPSGRLATTWPLRFDETCIPSFHNFPCTSKSDNSDPEISYEEGLQLGYRHPQSSETSRFPFGHGLSYSNFETSDLQVQHSVSSTSSPDTTVPYTQRKLTASVYVRNLGPYPGKHVVQLYLEPPSSPPSNRSQEEEEQQSNEKHPWRPHHELIAFTKAQLLLPGETTKVEMTFFEKDVTSTWDEEERSWKARGGRYGFVVADGLGDSAALKDGASCRVVLDLVDGDGVTWDGL